MHWCCSFKAYGDLVIACNNLRKTDMKQYGLLAGSHLRPLLNAIKFHGTLRVVEVGESVPAFFDVKKYGYVSAALNGLSLRRKIQTTLQQRDDTLVFDTLRVRERFLSWPFHADSIVQGTGNIYLDYSYYFGFREDGSRSIVTNRIKPIHRIYIFPDSRHKNKELPDGLILEIAKENSIFGKETILVKVGKPIDMPQFNAIQLQWVENFNQLVELVSKADLLVTADSLPAHLAEYFSIPVFVFSPIPNDYWMPLSCFMGGFYSGFESILGYKNWLNKYSSFNL